MRGEGFEIGEKEGESEEEHLWIHISTYYHPRM